MSHLLASLQCLSCFMVPPSTFTLPLSSGSLAWREFKIRTNYFYLRRSRQVIERWELLLLLLLLLLLGGDYFEVMTLEVDQLDQRSRSTFWMSNILFTVFPTQNFLRGGIRRYRSRSVAPWQDFSSGWDPLGLIKICRSRTHFLFGVGSLLLFKKIFCFLQLLQ